MYEKPSGVRQQSETVQQHDSNSFGSTNYHFAFLSNLSVSVPIFDQYKVNNTIFVRHGLLLKLIIDDINHDMFQ